MVDEKVQEESIGFVKKNVSLFIKKFADLTHYLPVEDPFSIFMAGSPGVGKTEFSLSLDPAVIDCNNKVPIVRIDPDEIKKEIPQYNGKNTDCVQGAATIIADKLFDHVQNHYQNVIVDTTFSDYNKSYRNLERAIKRNRKVGIVYIYQDPLIAWKFTKARELDEGRPIPKSYFINAYFSSKENVNNVKEIFGKKVNIILVEKNFLNVTIKTHINIDKIDNYMKLKYNIKELNDLLL